MLSVENARERLGPSGESKEPGDAVDQKMLEAISGILDRKLVTLATKDDMKDLKDIIEQQRLMIELLEAKIVLMEKYEQRIESLEKKQKTTI